MSTRDKNRRNDLDDSIVFSFIVNDIKGSLTRNASELVSAIAETLDLPTGYQWQIHRRSLDARDKADLRFVWQFSFDVESGIKKKAFLRLAKQNNLVVTFPTPASDTTPHGSETMAHRPVIVGSGPAGIFAAYKLAEEGYRPIIIERGRDVDQRSIDVEAYWTGKPLHPRSNVQFGEGGAGTFSDGKLTSRSKNHRGRAVLEIFSRHGAADDILWMQKPHIGTDVLRLVVKDMRETIIARGGSFYFETQLVDLLDQSGASLNLKDKAAELGAIRVVSNSGDAPLEIVIESQVLILALGHSARDSYRMLLRNGLDLASKPFAVGLRIEHLQEQIDLVQYGPQALNEYGKPTVGGILAPADYQLTWQDKKQGRGIYTFCMCPGGQVVASASEHGQQVVNGMSNRARNLKNANSAVLCTVTGDDFGHDAEDGLLFQERLERRAWLLGQGLDPELPELPEDAASRPAVAPIQLLGDFIQGKTSLGLGTVSPSFLPSYRFCDLAHIFPEAIYESLREGLIGLGKKLPGFAAEDAVLTAVESRSSAPLRITRDKLTLEATGLPSVYPIGEGSGYAGGIVSSAVDGLMAAEAIIAKYKAPD